MLKDKQSLSDEFILTLLNAILTHYFLFFNFFAYFVDILHVKTHAKTPSNNNLRHFGGMNQQNVTKKCHTCSVFADIARLPNKRKLTKIGINVYTLILLGCSPKRQNVTRRNEP